MTRRAGARRLVLCECASIQAEGAARVSNENLLVGDRALGAASAPRRKFNLTADPESTGRNGY
jgi:hypothetical protein